MQLSYFYYAKTTLLDKDSHMGGDSQNFFQKFTKIFPNFEP